MSEHLLKGKPLAEATDEELGNAYTAAMAWEAMADVWTPANEARLKAIEAEITKRPDFGKDQPI